MLGLNYPMEDAMDRVSDRERAQLRGAVKTVGDELRKTEYDPHGNILSGRIKNPDGSEYGDSYSYDARESLLSIVSHAWDGSTSEKSYFYDETGRPAKIVDSRGEVTTFDYDKQGHKTETRVIKNANEQEIPKAIGIDVMFADIDGSALLDFSFGGNAKSFKTIYNNQDQPTETQAYDAAGSMLGRFVRTFDEAGRITDVREITDNLMSMFPAKELAQMMAQSGIAAEEMRAEISRAMKVFGSESGKSYQYDVNGHIVRATVNGMMGTLIRTYIYNENGDVIEEQTDLSTKKGIPAGVPFKVSETGEIIPSKPPSEWGPEPDLGASRNIRYGYKYDEHGNWIERTVTFYQQPSFTTHRELTYY